MRRLLIIYIIFAAMILCSLPFTALRGQQKTVITGSVTDSLKRALPGASIRVFLPADSLYTSTDLYGRFSLTIPSPSTVILKATSLGFQPFTTRLLIDNPAESMVLPIILRPEPIVLSTVSVKKTGLPVVFRGDTIQYNADAFSTRASDKLEDLLKKLPGINVDRRGGVTAEGKALTKLTVNGQDFFNGDLSQFMKKLPAGIISSLEVINDFGNESKITGMKGATSVKALNLVTKPAWITAGSGRFQ